ncbi:MAG TPA: tetratricopeptide repeat protein [Candidatus Nanoarchaeia archaeon]|nr:tetratricopeptide repeat protein [Candidatus Nanoarchaeia archaeon]
MLTIERLLTQGKTLPWAKQEAHFTEAIGSIPVVVPKAEESLIAGLYNHRGRARRMLGNYADSRADYQMALAITTDPDQRALARINLADVHRVGFKDFPQAHASLDEALTFIENGTLIHAQAVDQRGLIFRAEGNYETALACYRRAINICAELLNLDLKEEYDPYVDAGYSMRVLRSLSAEEVFDRLAQIYQHQGEAAFDSFRESEEINLIQLAIESQKRVIELCTEHKLPNSTNSICNAKKMLGLIDLRRGTFGSAYEYLSEALKLAGEELKYPRAIGITSLYLAESILALNRGQEAVSYIKTFVDLVRVGSIPAHDYSIIKPHVLETLRLSKQFGFTIPGFEEVAKMVG